MARLELRLGAPVVHEDRRQGTLSGVLLHEAALRWEALIIRRGTVRRSSTIIPRAAVVDADDARVVIALPIPAHTAEVPAGRMIRAGVAVRLRDGYTAGRVRMVLAADDGQVTHVVVRSGRRIPGRMVPGECITTIDGSELTLDMTFEQFQSLPVYRPDGDIVWAVRRVLRASKPLALYEWPSIRVTVTDGVVTLAGHVSSRLRAEEAEARARAIPGVLAVENRLICDTELELEAAQALAQDPRTRSLALSVRAFRGVVTVSGQAPDAETAAAATGIVAALPTVRGVVNRITAPGFRPDAGWVEPPAVGTEVYAEDVMVGTVERLVIDPQTRRLTGLVVDARMLEAPAPWANRVERLVLIPMEQIRTITDTSVFLRGRAIDAARGPLAAEWTAPAAAGWQPPFPYPCTHVVWPSNAVAAGPSAPPRSGGPAAPIARPAAA